jgi:LacI family transcriptional regulator
MSFDGSSSDPRVRSRVADIAREAGVSTATVDRVLHRRPNVRPATAQRVLKAAAALRYLPDEDLFQAIRPAPMRLAFLLPAGTNRYLRMLGETVDYIADQLAPYNVRCRAHFIEGFNPAVLAERLLHHGRRSDGVAAMALEHPVVREAVRVLADEGVPVVTLVSDLAESRRAGYVGLDNRAAGRTAALLLGRFIGARNAQVALIAGSRSYRAHEEREMGFLRLFEEEFPQMEVVGLREGHDDADTNCRQAHALLEQFPHLAGIYNIGGASDGVGRALKEAGRSRKVVFVGHGLTPDTRALLIDGTLDAVITQSPNSVVTNAVRVFCNVRDGRDPMAGVESLRLSIVLRENLP